MKSLQRYPQVFCLTAGLTLGCLGLVNLAVDPDHIFRLVSMPGINAEKPLLDKYGMRKVKAIDLAQGQYDRIILGTSRSLGGLDPEHEGFGDRLAYNAGLSGTNFFETAQVYEFARQQHPLKQVIIELDFTGFSDWATVNADFDQSRFSGENTLPRDLAQTLSFGKLSDSWETLRFNQTGQPGQYTAQGFRRFRKYGDDQTQPSRLNHRELFTWTTQQFIKSHNRSHSSHDRLAMLQQLLQQCREDGTEVILFISPLHAHLMEALHEVEQYDAFEQWKRDLVALVEAETEATAHGATSEPNNAPQLWDFSGYSSITTEAVPSADSGQQMQWYAESSHYTQPLGDIMLELMLTGTSAQSPEGFASRLTGDMLEQHLATIRADRERYHQSQPQEIAEITRLAQAVLTNQRARR